jgi:hypothetical protein
LHYSVLVPRGNSPNWKVLDDRGAVVFIGHYRDCEEWLDLATMRESARGRLPDRSNGCALKSTVSKMNRLTEAGSGMAAIVNQKPA